MGKKFTAGRASAEGGGTVRMLAPAARPAVALLAPTSRAGPDKDRDGVEMGRANMGEPITKYWGPVAKFVSWPRAAPIAESMSRVKQEIQEETRIKPPRYIWQQL